MKGVTAGDTELYQNQMLAAATWCTALMKLRPKFIIGCGNLCTNKTRIFLQSKQGSAFQTLKASE